MSGGPSPGDISKGAIQRKVDEICNGPLRAAFVAALKDPGEGGQNWIRFLIDQGLDSRRAEYLRNVWFNMNGKGYWAEHQPTEPIVRQGLIEAIELASRDPDTQQERYLPIDSYWISVGDKFEVIITCSPQQVTRINLTPPIPAPPHDPAILLDMEPILIVKHGKPAEVEKRRAQDGQWVTVQLKAARRY